MKMTELSFEGGQPPIDGYAPGGFRVAGRFIEGPILLSPDGLSTWIASSVPALDTAAGARVATLADQVDLVVLGCGADMAPPPAAFRAALDAAGVGLEFMATPTACRTYNVLLSEDRRVAAALLPV